MERGQPGSNPGGTPGDESAPGLADLRPFLGPGAVSAEAVEGLAGRLRATDLDVGAAVAVVLRSNLFFGEEQLARRISPPASFVVATARVLEVAAGGLAPEVAAGWMRALGQDLLYPPGVGGWPGGRAWLGPSAMLERARFALRLAEGTLHDGARKPGPAALAKRYGQGGDPLAFAGRLLFG